MSLVSGTMLEVTATFTTPEGDPFDPVSVEAHMENSFKQNIGDAESVSPTAEPGVYVGTFQTPPNVDRVIIVFEGEGPGSEIYVGRKMVNLPYYK